MRVLLSKPKNDGTQKETIHIQPWDSWNADITLAKIAAPLLKQLRDTNHGYHIVDWFNTPYTEEEWNALTDCNNDVGSDHDERWKKVEAEWIKVMNEMIFALECVADNSWEEEFFTYKVENNADAIPAGATVTERMNNLVYDKEGHAAKSALVDRGLLLFGKYFRALWD